MATIGVVSVGMIGHLLPATRAGKELARAGHRVVFWAPGWAQQPIADRGFEARRLPIPIPPGAARWDIEADAGRMRAIAARTAEVTAEVTGHLAEALMAEEVDVVLHDAQAPWGRIAADWLGIPRACSFPLFPHVMDSAVRGKSRHAAPDEELLARLDVSREKIVRTWGHEIGPFPHVINNVADVTLCYSTPRILGGPPPDPRWNFVGPLLDRQEPARRAQAGPPRVYVSLGTMFNRRPEPFRAIIDALAGEWPVLVTTGGMFSAGALDPLPRGVEVVAWADPHEALAGAAVHVTHAGAGSVHEALAAGVPMVCVPQGSDNDSWARRVQDLGAGTVLEELDPAALRAAVRTLAADQAARERTAELAEHLRTYDGSRVLLAAVERLLS